MAKLDGKPTWTKRKTFTYKKAWPGKCKPATFIRLTDNITQNYSVGDVLSKEDQVRVDLGIVWETVCIENELADIHMGEPITSHVMECFENWNWRIENGEEPDYENHEEETATSF